MTDIILVDDDEAMRSFLQTALTRAGHRVTSFGDGLSAYNHLAIPEQPADLLLTDIVMPGMDGIELSQRALDLRPGIRIMYITGFGTVSRNTLPDRAQDAQVMAKPLHLSQLVSEVNRQLGITEKQLPDTPAL